jgi:hypothetical protein
MLGDVCILLLATHLGGLLVPAAAAAFGVGMSLLGRRYGPLRAAVVVSLLNPSVWLGVFWVRQPSPPEAPVGGLAWIGLLLGSFATFLSAYLPTSAAWIPPLLASPFWFMGWVFFPLTWAAISGPVWAAGSGLIAALEPLLRWLESVPNQAFADWAARAFLFLLTRVLPALVVLAALAAAFFLYRTFLRRVQQPAPPGLPGAPQTGARGGEGPQGGVHR